MIHPHLSSLSNNNYNRRLPVINYFEPFYFFFGARTARFSIETLTEELRYMSRSVHDRRTSPVPRRRSTYQEIRDHFAVKVEATKSKYEALVERVDQIEDFLTSHEDRFEITLRDLNVTDNNVDKLKEQIETLKSNIRELDSCVYKIHERVFDFKSDMKKTVDDKVAEIMNSLNCRLELIEAVFASL